MNVNDEFILDIKRLGINGEGIGYYNKLAIFVPNAIPREGHNVKITKLEKKYAYAESLEIKTKSEFRKEPLCPYFKDCGACQVMHIDYDKMLEFKRDLLIESLTKYTKLNPRSFEIRKTIPSPKQLNYRNRSIQNIRRTKDGLKIFMIKENSNNLVPIDKCLVEDNVINNINNKIISIGNKLNIDTYNQKLKKGALKYVSIRVNELGDALVTFICHERDNKINKLAEELINVLNVKGIYLNINNTNKQGEIFGEELIHLAGEKYIIMTLNNIKYKLYPDTFFQLNTDQAKNIFDIVLKNAKLSKKETVLDAYCGVGAISLYIAKMAKEVIGIEYNKNAIDLAKENALLNKINKTEFYQGDSSILLEKMLNEGKKFDVIIVDPPRTGLDDKFINNILKSEAKKIIYVSCNPQTLAKNLDKLSVKYNVNSMTPADMFPYSAHVEVISVLTKKVA